MKLKKKTKRKINRFITSIIFIYFALFIGIQIIEQQSIYYPDTNTYSDLSIYNVKDVFLELKSGEKIHSIYKRKHPRKVILYFHGNASNISLSTPEIQLFEQLGYSYMIVDYPGYGKSKGRPRESTIYEAAETAYEFLIQEKAFKAKDITLFGTSLGGGVAIDLASKKEIHSVIAQSTFTSTHDMYKELFPQFPYFFFTTNKYKSIYKLEDIKSPILFLHGDQDTTISISHSQSLYNKALDPKFLGIIPNADHNNVISIGGQEYMNTLKKFIEKKSI